ncbi:MAG: DNA replication/repair protein RecF [Dongiaceae bacterium]
MSNAPALRQSAPSDAIRHSAGPVVWLERLVLTDFRNYGRAEIHLDRRPVVLTGPNGAGKTNLLEAISFLIPGRGLRHARLPDIDRMIPGETDGQPRRAAWGIAATVNRPGAQIDLGTGRDPAAAGRDRRLVKIDGALAGGQSALAQILSVAWLTPQMDRLFLDGALHRRKFTDRLVFGLDPDHAKRLGQYGHLLQERVQVLRGEGERWRDPAWLAALEQQIAERGIAISAARRDLITRLTASMAAGPGPFPRALLRLEGAVDSWLGEMPALAAEERLRDMLAHSRAADAEAGGALWGPHRSDLVAIHQDSGMPAALCSTGEQKALLVATVLAFARLLADLRAQTPLLLLDEVVAHLDETRRHAFFGELRHLGLQAWLTGTDAAFFDAMAGDAQFFDVRDAKIAPRSV